MGKTRIVCLGKKGKKQQRYIERGDSHKGRGIGLVDEYEGTCSDVNSERSGEE